MFPCAGAQIDFMSEDDARWIFQQLIIAVDYCHRLGIANRDVKVGLFCLRFAIHAAALEAAVVAVIVGLCHRSSALLPLQPEDTWQLPCVAKGLGPRGPRKKHLLCCRRSLSLNVLHPCSWTTCCCTAPCRGRR